MIDPSAQFAALMQRVQDGEQQAAWELLEEYGSHLQRYVRRSLSKDLRTRFDSVDFVQVVWASFFREPDRLRRITTPAGLMAYLATLARNKVVTEVRRGMHAQKRDLRREIRIDAVRDDDRQVLTSRDPTPSAVAMFRERWDRLVDGQPAQVRRIVELRFQGATYTEIAEQLHIHERTARKAIERLVEDEVAEGKSGDDLPGPRSREEHKA
ncbi:MAG: sigma-70 family RNA polymerase sigma factor [Pirellulaceae bacterium]